MYIGIDLGGTNIAAGIVDKNCNIINKCRLKTNVKDGADAVLAGLRNIAFELVKEAGISFDEIDGIGIAVPGAVDRRSGTIVYTCNVPFHNAFVGDIFKPEFRCPVFLENDANAAALGEYKAGAAKGHSNCVMLMLGTGIGAGIIINDRLYTGANGLAGEIGHTVIVAGGRECTCGRRGCFEAYASVTGLIRLTREKMLKHPETRMWDAALHDLSRVGGRTAFALAKEGDAAAVDVVDEYLYYLSVGVTNAVNLFQPEILLIGGGISNEGDTLINPVIDFVNRERYGKDIGGPVIKAAVSSGNTAIIGAATFGVSKLLQQEIKE